MGSVSLTLVNIEQRVHPDLSLKNTLMSRFLQTCLMSSLIPGTQRIIYHRWSILLLLVPLRATGTMPVEMGVGQKCCR